ncbi:MAG TPA: N-6 DNA methylase, partial [Blastocatellia bacterium]|nr:N-6 DNA methylase [Blastocatellia bacterium]
MPIPVQPSLIMDSKPYNNRGLFADHFLEDPQRLQAMEEWTQAEGATGAFQVITRLYSNTAGRFNKRTNESQTEEEFIRPILNLLWGRDCYKVQPRIPNVDVQRQPDYAFFRSVSDRDSAEPRLGTLDYWRDVPCLCDAKRWTASLDKERSADENPSAQICNYLYRSRVRWGILSNGRIWRLYEREKSSAGGIYYEVNLEELIKNGNSDTFKYFYLFFRRAAFLPDANGLSFVEKVFQGSVDYATEVGDRLKDSVYDALRLLMNGFFEYGVNQLDRRDSNTLKEVHENALIVLYRLLFLLYAEDRELLPCKVEPYASNSLYRLQREINQYLRADGQYAPIGRRFWGELTNLFTLIDEGFPEGGIPEYNGGLFSPSKHPHIAHTPQAEARRWEIGDHRLAQVIDMLAYQRERWNEPGANDIDYNTLDVQHLGSIYEGLLELQPQIASEPMIETIEDGKAIFKLAREVANPRPVRGQPPRMIAADEVYLVTNRGERKATGSYYTPKYIVDYIVENTVGPRAEAAALEAATLRPQVEKEISKLKRKRREWEKSSRPEAANQIAGFDKMINEQKRQLLEPYLRLRVLDPAMGSGHFLVGTADFLSLAMATDPNILSLEEVGGEDPQAFYKRLVVERCLYGVDLNQLAVELAKLSLWLHTVSHDKALSFLDHHLRCGNSLIGARVEDNLSTTPPELDARGRIKKRDERQLILGFTETLTATHLQFFLDTFGEIIELMPGDAENERMKDRLYREMDAQREKFRAVANIWLAPYFGVAVSPEQYQASVAALRGTEAGWQQLAEEEWFNDAQSVARKKRFFHWELEFPEVFFNPDGLKLKAERGFDVVNGNPPYVDIKGL